jgi:outer membrane protein, heavy metal efflux system
VCLCSAAQAEPPSIAAVQPEGAVESLTLADAIRLAIEHNPDFRSTGYDVVSAQGAVVQASVLPNPSVFLYSIGRGFKPFQAPVPTQFGLTWTIPVGGKISAATDAAKATLASAKSTREANRRQLVVNVQTAFTTLLLDQAQRAFSEQDAEGFHRELDLNELRYKDGKIAFGDLLKLRIQAVSIDDALREAALAVEGARADLRHVVGEGVLARDFRVVGELGPSPKPSNEDADALLEQALRNRPDYLALLDQQKSAERSLVVQRRTPIPDISILLDYNRPVDDTDASYDVSLSVPIPLFDRNQGNVTQAEATYEKSKLAEESLRTQMRSDLVKALREWDAASALLSAYQAGTVDEAKQSLEIARHAYELGTGSLLDFLDAEASYRQIEGAYRAAMARTSIAAQNIRFITGEVQQ